MREHTDEIVLTEGVRDGWADPETDPAKIDWTARLLAAAIPFKVVNGRPVNPCEKDLPVQRGRNGLGRWSENLTADALVSVRDEFGDRWVVLVERNRGRGWGLPGGFLNPGETPVEAAWREFLEEADADLRYAPWWPTKPRYVRNKRASAEAWMVTVMCTADLGTLRRNAFPKVAGKDDVLQAAWIRANTMEELVADLKKRFGGEVTSPNHVGMLTDWFEQN
ncbi:NUDIX domain-containing protein [Actinomadura sp. DSM 109109]|nr:NUDIX domain-containing protein [Actinomadura lepetitiana]